MVSSKKGRKDSEEANSSSEGRKKEAAGGGQIEQKPGKAKKKESSDISATGKRIIPEVPSWIKIASENDPIYKKGYMFGGTYSRSSSKSSSAKTSETSKKPLTIEEEYEEAVQRIAREKAPKSETE